MSVHLIRVASCCALALAVAACSPRQEPAEDLAPRVDALLESGDAAGALAMLGERDLSDEPALRQLLAEAQIMDGRYDDALQTLTTLEPTAAVDVLRADACVMGSLAALDDDALDAAESRMAPCAGEDRLDAAAVRALVEAHASDDIDRTVLDELVGRLFEAESSPETDVAAEALQRAYLLGADRAPEVGERIQWMSAAFVIGRDPELGDELVALITTTADSLAESEPQAAATWYEYLYLDRIEGLPVSEEERERAGRAAREVLFPVFVRNQFARYLRKFGDEDAEAGRFDPASETWTVAGGGDEDTRAWLYAIYERPMPTEGPDLLAARELCTESGPCTLSVDELMGVLYRVGEIEQAWSDETGTPIAYPPPE